jgi:hypothetical protein
MISKEEFNPRHFLRSVHKTTTLSELEKGILSLKSSVEKRQVVLKELVKSNFDRFINAKNVIDGTCNSSIG